MCWLSLNLFIIILQNMSSPFPSPPNNGFSVLTVALKFEIDNSLTLNDKSYSDFLFPLWPNTILPGRSSLTARLRTVYFTSFHDMPLFISTFRPLLLSLLDFPSLRFPTYQGLSCQLSPVLSIDQWHKYCQEISPRLLLPRLWNYEKFPPESW